MTRDEAAQKLAAQFGLALTAARSAIKSCEHAYFCSPAAAYRILAKLYTWYHTQLASPAGQGGWSVMAPIPRTATALVHASREVKNFLVAAVLASEEDQLIVREEDIKRAETFQLIVTDVDGDGVVLSVRPR